MQHNTSTTDEKLEKPGNIVTHPHPILSEDFALCIKEACHIRKHKLVLNWNFANDR